jgi:glycosyltransferase involved in cell wall biosynthesis
MTRENDLARETPEVRTATSLIQGYFKAFNLFVLTSDHEPFGMVLLEAMAAGLPIICSDCGGGKEVVEGYGSLFPLGDMDNLAKQIVLCNTIFNQKSEAEIRQYLDHFTDEAVKRNFWSLGRVANLLQKESANA